MRFRYSLSNQLPFRLNDLYESLLYEQVWIIDLESSFRNALGGERNIIIDHDLCVIRLD